MEKKDEKYSNISHCLYGLKDLPSLHSCEPWHYLLKAYMHKHNSPMPKTTFSYDAILSYALKKSSAGNGDTPAKAVPDWNDVADTVCGALEDALKQDDGEYDRPRIKNALETLRRDKSRENVIATVKKLCQKEELADFMKGVAATLQTHGDKLDELVKRRDVKGGGRKLSRGNPPKKGTGLMGRKTKRMAKQLRQFREHLDAIKFTGDESKLYGLAANFWNRNRKAFEKAKTATGQKRGYSAPKVLADAYKNAL